MWDWCDSILPCSTFIATLLCRGNYMNNVVHNYWNCYWYTRTLPQALHTLGRHAYTYISQTPHCPVAIILLYFSIDNLHSILYAATLKFGTWGITLNMLYCSTQILRELQAIVTLMFYKFLCMPSTILLKIICWNNFQDLSHCEKLLF